MTIAYSYIRFSTPIQKHGRSHDRQMEGCIKWCAKNNVTLSEERFFDEGKSGYTGEHLGEKGQLKRFLDKVEAKDSTIPKGSYLIIESLDRLSRQKVNEALPLFMQILNADINIVTLMDGEKVYTKDFTAQDVIMSVFVMARANEESATKSKRGLDDWKSKFALARKDNKPFGKRVGKWLELVDREDGKGKEYAVIPERVAVIERIFQMCIDGIGQVTMARTLNNQGLKGFKSGEGWCPSSVTDLLNNRSLLGEWLPGDGGGVIEGYFPVVIEASVWLQAQAAMESRRGGKVTRQAPNFQIWQGIAKCALCGSSMHSVTKGKGKGKQYKYLTCAGKRKGICESPYVRLDKSEEVFRHILVKLPTLSLIQTDSKKAVAELEAVKGLLLRYQQELQAIEQDLEAEYSPTLANVARKKEKEIASQVEKKEALEMARANEIIKENDKAWFIDNVPFETYEERSRANALLKRLNVSVAIGENGYTIRQDEQAVGWLFVDEAGKVQFMPHNEDMLEKMKVQDVDGSFDAVMRVAVAEIVLTGGTRVDEMISRISSDGIQAEKDRDAENKRKSDKKLKKIREAVKKLAEDPEQSQEYREVFTLMAGNKRPKPA